MLDYDILKKHALEKYFEHLNEPQRQAVFITKGPLLILAGAGSGKTTVLINRIAYMIRFGDAYAQDTGDAVRSEEELRFLESFASGGSDDGAALADIIAKDRIRPYNILAITFTNKAAGELKSRIGQMLGSEGEGVTACTFHSLCARILRRECLHIGFDSSFTIYDTDDSLRVIKQISADMNINPKLLTSKTILGYISKCKESMTFPKAALADANDYQFRAMAGVYAEYQQRLKSSNAMDFDDLLCHTVQLFDQEPDVLDHYQNLYKYIMVDEYQDTNTVQFLLVRMLAAKYSNICVVGDDDQSIYKFRGATIENILSFEDTFGCDRERVIRLEENYRSTQYILDCANELIKNNNGRKGKTLFTRRGAGEKVRVFLACDEKREGDYIAETIVKKHNGGAAYNDFAVLYRTNAQSREIERALKSNKINYKIFGGVKFYDRKEIKDMLAYLQVINNESDMLRLRRIINEPKRGIGDSTVTKIEQISSDLGITPVEVMLEADGLAPIVSRASKLRSAAEMFRYFQDIAETLSLSELLDEILDRSGYRAMLEADGQEGAERLANIEELKSSMEDYENETEDPTLSGYLEEISLFTDIDTFDENADYVALMTMHAAKGLEFPCVFAAGMEENLFPSSQSLSGSEDDIEEERRLCYVAITRAQSELHLIYTEHRMLYGSISCNRPSRFLRELPDEAVIKVTDPAIESRVGSLNSVVHPKTDFGKQLKLRQMSVTASGSVDFSVGDRILHKIFGEGTVLKVTSMANDALLEIAFDSRGTKKVMAKYAKIEKI